MSALPTLSFAFANQWILLLLHAAVFALATMRLPRENRHWLFKDHLSALPEPSRVLRRLGQLLAVLIIALLSLSPLPRALTWHSALGLLMYLSGSVTVLLALYSFGQTPRGELALGGPYRFSRNPQWVGGFLVLLGLAIAAGSWGIALAVFAFAATYHPQILAEERACREMFGDSYEEYSQRVPRYLFK